MTIRELEFTILLRNNRLKALRRQAGLTQKELADACGVSDHHIGWAENFKPTPWWLKKEIARYFGRSPSWMFPKWTEEIRGGARTKRIGKQELTSNQAVLLRQDERHRLLLPTPEEALLKKERAAECLSLIESLPAREQTVIRMRYGLGQQHESKLEEVAQALLISRARAGQLERKAIWKMYRVGREREGQARLTEYLNGQE